MTKPGFWSRLHHDVTNRGPAAWVVAALLLAFYVDLYYTDHLTAAARAIAATL